jgi:hypothetical protein
MSKFDPNNLLLRAEKMLRRAWENTKAELRLDEDEVHDWLLDYDAAMEKPKAEKRP